MILIRIRRALAIGLALLPTLVLLLLLVGAAPVRAAGTVGTGTAGSCDDAALNLALAGGGLVIFNCGASPVTITIGVKTIAANTTIQGGGLVSLSGNHANQLFIVSPGVTLVLDGLTLSHGFKNGGHGGAIYNSGRLVVTNSQFFDNHTYGFGGAIFNLGTLTVTNSIFGKDGAGYGNSGTNGGSIYNAGTATLTGNRYDTNTAVYGGGLFNSGTAHIANDTYVHNFSNSGGGLYNAAGAATLSATDFISNQASYQGGGGLYNDYGTVTVTGGRFTFNRSENNSAQANMGLGGGVHNHSGTASFTDVTFNWNRAQLGGAIFNTQTNTVASLIVNGGLINGNYVSNFFGSGRAGGAGIYNDQGLVNLANTSLITNTADFYGAEPYGSGGAGFFNNGGTATLTNAAIVSNTSVYDGGAVLNNAGRLTISRSRLVGNEAWYGGGIENRNPGTELLLVDTTLSGNRAYDPADGGSGSGGGLDNYDGAWATLQGVTMNDNFAFTGGGVNNEGVDSPDGQLWVTNSTLSHNTAEAGAGGLNNAHARATLLNVTLALNASPSGGNLSQVGVLPTQTLTVTASLLVHGPAGGNCLVTSGSVNIVSGNYNLADDTTCNPYFNQANDQNNVSGLLGPLADNGGPTFSHLPAEASLAVDHGGPACPSTDQRGLVRPHGPACDVGAVEVGAGAQAKLYLPLVMR